MTDMELNSIPTVLACDVGNTTIQLALVTGDEVSSPRTVGADDQPSLATAIADLWAQAEPPRRIVAASVNPPALAGLEAVATSAVREDVLIVGEDIPLPASTALPEPEAIGVDRLCCAAAAYDRLGTACIVADFGSAITIDYVGDDGVFMGGAILPGLAMSARCLSENTAQLPRVDLVQPDWVFGRNTREAIIGGVIRGARGALREIAETYATETGNWPTVIVTGGDAGLICSHVDDSDMIQAVVPDLALRGVAMAYYGSLVR